MTIRIKRKIVVVHIFLITFIDGRREDNVFCVVFLDINLHIINSNRTYM
jgi:hypothetical protein